jgi:lipopolysaccharide biosynthesis glycosyltransferase
MLEHATHASALHFHVMDGGLTEEDRAVLRASLNSGPAPATINFLGFDQGPVQDLQRSRVITRTAYARLFLGEALPPEVERCVYVDCDLLFERDVTELWATDLDGHVLGAVDNALWDDPVRYQRRLGLANPAYFNSGVLLVDVVRWRASSVGERAILFARRAGDRLILHDQDALNGALDGAWLRLAPYWNMWVIHPSMHADSRAVFHFMGAPKPWQADYAGRFADKFYDYLDRTAYAGARPWNPAGLGRAMRRLRRTIPYLPSAVRILRSRLSSSRP